MYDEFKCQTLLNMAGRSTIEWIKKTFPDELEELLLNKEEEGYEDDEESEKENKADWPRMGLAFD